MRYEDKKLRKTKISRESLEKVFILFHQFILIIETFFYEKSNCRQAFKSKINIRHCENHISSGIRLKKKKKNVDKQF